MLGIISSVLTHLIAKKIRIIRGFVTLMELIMAFVSTVLTLTMDARRPISLHKKERKIARTFAEVVLEY